MTREEEIRAEKKHFTRKIEELLKADPRSGISSCEYITKEHLGAVGEYVELTTRSGQKSRICVTADSLGAILRDVTRQVYHYG